MIENKQIYRLFIVLLFCLIQIGGMIVHAQDLVDSLRVDSIAAINRENMAKLNPVNPKAIADSIPSLPPPDKKVWIPNPGKATWLAVVFPGGGQIYNRKYWKLPIIYGGFAGCAYALSWNNKMFRDYSQAYVDIMDGDPLTNSYYDLLRGVVIDEKTDTRYGPILKKRKDYYRRYRDISVFAFIGVYILSIIDAYVDAELSNFDITPDLSMHIEPVVMDNRYQIGGSKSNTIGVQCSFRF